MLKIHTSFGSLLLLLAASNPGAAAERPTMNITNDPRPDILAHPIYYAHTEYRRAYNRPRFLGGWMAEVLAPSSQEAMVWRENLQAGRYDSHNQPPVYKRYCYPKPWEVLATGARPDFPKPQSSNGVNRPNASLEQNAIDADINVEELEQLEPNSLPPVPVPR